MLLCCYLLLCCYNKCAVAMPIQSHLAHPPKAFLTMPSRNTAIAVMPSAV